MTIPARIPPHRDGGGEPDGWRQAERGRAYLDPPLRRLGEAEHERRYQRRIRRELDAHLLVHVGVVLPAEGDSWGRALGVRRSDGMLTLAHTRAHPALTLCSHRAHTPGAGRDRTCASACTATLTPRTWLEQRPRGDSGPSRHPRTQRVETREPNAGDDAHTAHRWGESSSLPGGRRGGAGYRHLSS